MSGRVGLLSACLLSLEIGSLFLASDAFADTKKDRNRTIKQLELAIPSLNIKSIYVPDFLDADGSRTDRGALLAAGFSKLLSEHARSFRVTDRSAVQRSYESSRPSTSDLQKVDTLTQLAINEGAEAILLGTVSRDAKSLGIELSVIDCRTQKELYHLQHREDSTAGFDAYFPATSDSSGRIFYFAGYDGTTMPKCIHCPNPSYTDRARSARISGVVHLSMIITEQGTVDGVRIAKQLEQTLDQAALNAVKNWRFYPTKRSDGTPVSVRMLIEVSFQLR
jgi:TonB family protein